jgi:hypothetical protein
MVLLGVVSVCVGVGKDRIGDNSPVSPVSILRTPTEFFLFAPMTCTLPDNTWLPAAAHVQLHDNSSVWMDPAVTICVLPKLGDARPNPHSLFDIQNIQKAS